MTPVPPNGPVAQLGARFHGMEEVVSSNLTRSTNHSKPVIHFSASSCPLTLVALLTIFGVRSSRHSEGIPRLGYSSVIGNIPRIARLFPRFPYRPEGSENTDVMQKRMQQVVNLVWLARIWVDREGQDLIEYTLMAGFVAVAAGAIMPGVTSSISRIFSKVSSVMANSAS